MLIWLLSSSTVSFVNLLNANEEMAGDGAMLRLGATVDGEWEMDGAVEGTTDKVGLGVGAPVGFAVGDALSVGSKLTEGNGVGEAVEGDGVGSVEGDAEGGIDGDADRVVARRQSS